MNLQRQHPFVDITNKLNHSDRISKKQRSSLGSNTLSKYTRSVNQQSERTKNTLKFMSVSREPSLIYAPSSTQNDAVADDMEGETLSTDNDLICTDKMKRNLEIKRMPTMNTLPSFSFSYSFASTKAETNKQKVSKEKVGVFKQRLREARRRFVMKEMVLKAENMDKHSELSITAAESLLDLRK